MIDYVTEDPIITEIRDWICEEYSLIYTKNFKLYKELFDDSTECNYGIGIEMGNFERPIIVGGQFSSDTEYVAYFKKEFKSKQLYRIPLFQGVKIQIDDLDNPLFFYKRNGKGEWVTCETQLVENRQIRQIQNEHNP